MWCGERTVASDDEDAAEPHPVLPHLPGVRDGADEEEYDEDDCSGDGRHEAPEVVFAPEGEELSPGDYRHARVGGHGGGL